MRRVLLIGYGNPGRLDDGLGPALTEMFLEAVGTPAVRIAGVPPAEEKTPFVAVESNYQLNVEDAAQIAEVDVVVFADASADAEPPFTFSPVIREDGGLTFSSHSVSAPQLMGMVKDLFHVEPAAYILAIRGYVFNEFGEGLSEQAQENLKAAVRFLSQWIKEKINE